MPRSSSSRFPRGSPCAPRRAAALAPRPRAPSRPPGRARARLGAAPARPGGRLRLRRRSRHARGGQRERQVQARARGPRAARAPEMEERFSEFFGPEFFDRFFRRRSPRDEGRAAGSGVIVDPRGYILTNNHVVENAAEIEVRLSDDRKFKATLVGRDAKTDLAVLKIENPPGPLPVAELGDSDRLRVGQWAIAIGNPFGLDRTVTVGIISATGRTRVGVATYEAFIQTDASINPGNSGGPLLNLDGRRHRHQHRHRRHRAGHRLLDPDQHGARRHGPAHRPRARGARLAGHRDPGPHPRSRRGLRRAEAGGVLVADVMKDGPADGGGVAGRATSSWSSAGRPSRRSPTCRSAWPRWSRAAPPVTVIRDKRPSPCASIASASSPPRTRWRPRRRGEPGPHRGAAHARDGRSGLRPRRPQRAWWSPRSAPGSAGAEAGIRPGDAILEVNRRPVGDTAAFRQAVAGLARRVGASVPAARRRRQRVRRAHRAAPVTLAILAVAPMRPTLTLGLIPASPEDELNARVRRIHPVKDARSSTANPVYTAPGR